jgi:hypothetical protein
VILGDAGGTLVVGAGRVQVAPGGRSAAITVSAPRDNAPPLFPDLPLLTLDAPPATEVTISIPYSDAFLSAHAILDESALGIYERREDGLWSHIASHVDTERREVTADVTAPGTWAVAPSWLLKAWQPPALVGDQPVAGARNVIVLHGWNASPWDACQLELMQALASHYDHVAAFAYPSALDIAESARDLATTVRQFDPGAAFDIVGFSEGGLVARAAIESGYWNEGETIARRVPRLFTIATPHEGVLAGLAPSVLGDVASEEMRPGSLFLRNLNGATRPTATRYIAIAGDAADGGASDGLVGVESALGFGILPDAERIVLPLLHAATYGGGSGMPCDAAVYRALGG